MQPATELNARSTSDYGTYTANEQQQEEKKVSINIEENTSNIEEDKNEPEGTQTFTLELPRSILTAYILIHINGEWTKYSLCGKIGLVLALAIPLFVQGLATASLAASLEWKNLKIETDAEELIYNIAALAALFIYMFNDIAALTNSTWYYLGKMERERDIMWPSSVGDRLKNFHRLHSHYKALKNVPKNITSTNFTKARQNINFLQFRILIIATMAMYVILTFYGIMEMNRQLTLVYKLDVALSIFIILQVDDWGYKLFVMQNRILLDDDFDVELIASKSKHEMTQEKKENSLWYTIFIVLFVVAVVVVASVVSNIYETYFK